MSQLGDAADRHEDVLDSGPPRRLGRWLVVGAVAVLALVGWNAFGSGSDLRQVQIQPTPVPDRSGGAQQPAATVPANPDHADQLVFADAQHGFLMQYLCSRAAGLGACPRRILATEDGGSTWEGRAVIPPYADGFYALTPLSGLELVLVDQLSADSVVRSFDGGRSWAQSATFRAASAPVPAGALLVADQDRSCAPDCAGVLSWIDPDTLALHPLPTQPAAAVGQPPPTMARDGQLALAAAEPTAGLVSVSTDGGGSWTETRLEVRVDAGQDVGVAQVIAAGAGRVYAFIQLFDSSGLAAKYGFRSDDAGVTWIDLGTQDPLLWVPVGVLSGELVSTDLPGRVMRSSAGGTEWAEVGSVAGGPYLSQARPDGMLLATVLNSQGFERYFLSADGQDWMSIQLPAV